MRYSEHNFLYGLKQLVTGSNKQVNTTGTVGQPDGGIKIDFPFQPNEIVNSSSQFPAITDNTTGTPSTTFGAIAGATYATDAPAIKNALAEIALILNAQARANGTINSGKQSVFIAPAGTNVTVGNISTLIPRDYDEASDELIIRLPVFLANADANITLTGTATFQPTGGTATTGTAVTATLPFSTVAANLSQTEQVVEINLSGLGLKRDTILNVALALVGTTTGNTNFFGYDVTYDSCIVSYNDTDQSGVDGALSEYGNPLR